MEFDVTNRGYGIYKFNEGNGHACSLQESSACHNEGLIWLGIDDAAPVYFEGGKGWQPLPLPEHVTKDNVLYHSRMHLTQSHVEDMLPALLYFTKHGVLPDENVEASKQEMDGFRESVRLIREGD